MTGRARPPGPVRGWTFTSLALVLAGCGESPSLVVHGPLPEATETIVVALEQGEQRAIQAHRAAEGPLRLELPAPFEESEPLQVTRIALRAPLGELGLSRSGPLPSDPPRPRPLSRLERLAVENASLLVGSAAPATFASGVASAWVLEHPVARPDICLKGVRVEFARMSGGPRDLLAARDELAVAVLRHELVTFDATGQVRPHALVSPELGRAAGLGVGGRIWVVTSSRAAVFDPSSGSLTESVLVPPGPGGIGVAEDPETGDLYLLTAAVELWRRPAGGPGFERLFRVPPERVRSGVEDKAARFHFTGPRRALVAVEDVSVVLEIEGDTVRTLSGAAVGSGFPVSARTRDGRILLVESARGDLFEYQPGRLEPMGQLPTRLVGLVVLAEPGPRLFYVGASGAMGTVDLGAPEGCSDIQASGIVSPDGLVPVGDRLIVRGEIEPGSYGLAWLDLEL